MVQTAPFYFLLLFSIFVRFHTSNSSSNVSTLCTQKNSTYLSIQKQKVRCMVATVEQVRSVQKTVLKGFTAKIQ
jgi:hypothetical protein